MANFLAFRDGELGKLRKFGYLAVYVSLNKIEKPTKFFLQRLI